MRILSVLLLAFVLSSNAFSQREYKALMADQSVNFYDVVKSADKYFETHPTGKGSGWKGYQRWRAENEPKYYPSGDRTIVDEWGPSKSWKRLLKENPTPESLFNGWKDLGPYTIDSITGHYAPGLGRVESFYVDPSNSQLIYLGSRSGGFWKSTDGGAHWVGTVSDTLVANGVNTIAVNPNNPDSILINVRNSNNGVTHGIYRSVDGGVTFTSTPFNPSNLSKGGLGSNFGINKIYIHRNDPDLVFVTAGDGLYRSTDNLQTWTKITNGSIKEIEIHPTNDDIIYIYDYYYWGSNKDLVLRSTDRGLTFNPSATISGNNGNTGVSLAVSNDCANCLYFGSGNGIWVSLDTGNNFTKISTPSQGGNYLMVHDQDTSRMVSGGIDAYMSKDGGKTFTQSTWWSLGSVNFNSSQYIHADLREGASINGTYYMATDGYLACSPDTGKNWSRLSDSVGTRENYRLGLSQSNHHRTICGSQDNGTSIKHETVWLEAYGADGMEGFIHPLNDNYMIGSWQNGGRRRTLDGGLTGGSVTPPGQSGDWIAPMVYDPMEQMRVYSYGENVHRSDDFGSSWTQLGTPSFSGKIQHAAIAENNTSVMFASRGEDLERSTDGGQNWVDFQGTLPSYSISDIAFAPNDDNIVMVTYARYQDDGQKVFLSTDMGNSWTNVTYNLNDMPIRTIVIDHTDSMNIYVGAEIGVFTKSMNDTVWQFYNQDLPNVTMRDLEVMYGSNTLRGATWGRGLWEYSLVGRKDYPAIMKTSISNQPTFNTPKENTDQYVTSLISYTAGNLSSVYVKWSAGGATFDSTLTMSNTMDSTWVSDLPIPKYPVGTKMYFKVFAVGASNDTTETYKFMYEVQAFAYCTATGNSGTTADWIKYVELENLANTSLKMSYYYYANKPVYLWLDSTYNLEITMNYHWEPDTTYGFFDWNHNAEFESNETVFMSMLNSNHESFGTFTVPSTAYTDDTIRFRARSQYWNQGPKPCGDATGEVEDYPLIVRTVPDISFVSNPPAVCGNAPIAFQFTGGVHDSLTWSLTNGISTVLGTKDLDSLQFPTAGVYDLTLTVYKYGMSWTQTSNSVVTISQGPTVTGSATADSICLGEMVTLTSGGNAANYSWSGGVLEGQAFAPISTMTYTVTGTDTVGCGNAAQVTVHVTAIDTSVTLSSETLTATTSSSNYQWLDCSNGQAPISGATGQSFQPTASGLYAVQINTNGCLDTSACHAVTVVGTDGRSLANLVRLYPNPTEGAVRLELGKDYPTVSITVFDEMGKEIHSEEFAGRREIDMNFRQFAAGVYFMQVRAEEEVAVLRFVKGE